MNKFWIALVVVWIVSTPAYAQLPGIDAPTGAAKDRDVSGQPIRGTDDTPAVDASGETTSGSNAQTNSGSPRGSTSEDRSTGMGMPGSGEGKIEGSGPISGAPGAAASGSISGSNGSTGR